MNRVALTIRGMGEGAASWGRTKPRAAMYMQMKIS